MKKSIKNTLLTLATVALLGSQAVMAQVNVSVGDRIKFSDGPGAGNGGAFLITDWGPTGAAATGSFMSFCVEVTQYMNFTDFFKVNEISTAAKNGGSGGAVNGQDPLDVKTAWLYTQYIENPSALSSVSGWDSANEVDRGTAMQQAIWLIEDEITSTSNTLASALVIAAGDAGWTDVGRVKILNVVTLNNGAAQDQLYITPVPEPEIYAMMAAGLGLMGFVARRRKQHDDAVV